MLKKPLLILSLSLVFMFMQFSFADRASNTSVINSMTFGLHRAAHDASLQIDPEKKAEGYIVFKQDQALNVFKETLVNNLRLKDDLTPLPNTLFKDPVEIIFEDYIDDFSGVTFPFNYRNDQFKIYKTIEGPAVIYEIRVKSPRTTKYSYDGYIYKNIVQEYPFPR